MLFLQQAIFELDAELDRLSAIRSIVAGLAIDASQPKPVTGPSLDAGEPQPESREVPAAPVRRSRPRKIRAARTLKAPPSKARETTALNGAVPSAPVVLSVQALQRERDSRTDRKNAEEFEQVAVVPQVALDLLSRDLTARWLTGSGSSAQIGER